MIITINDLIIFVILGLYVVLTGIGILLESKAYNNGICPICGDELLLFDYDSGGCRGYVCGHCSNYVWVSYKCVDKRKRW
jgi:hypothetical protein